MADTSMLGLPEGQVVNSAGLTKLTDGLIDGWIKALPDQEARKMLEAYAVMTAAGVEAELRRGVSAEDVRCRGDLLNLVGLAHLLGVGSSTEDPAVTTWIRALCVRAWGFLRQDGKAAWDRVTSALTERRSLSGDEVKALVAGPPKSA